MSISLEELFDEISDRLLQEDETIALGKIMHSVGLSRSGRFFAFHRRGELVVKLAAERVAELVSSGEGIPFYGGKSAPLKEWVALPSPDPEAALGRVLEALAFARGG